MKNRSAINVPVLYYHSVANHKHSVNWSFLSCEIRTFVLQMKFLAKWGYSTCTWAELDSHLQGTKQLPEKTVMIQFDDGFLDNWTTVFPIMRRLGFKFSIVVSSDFIGHQSPRPFLTETLGVPRLFWWGYLSEEELVAMERSGIVDIQAHGWSHTWLPVSERIVDVYDESQNEPWIFWNENIDLKTSWLDTDLRREIPTGYPIFESEKSLSNQKAFIPDRGFIEECVDCYDPSLSREENLATILRKRDEYKVAGKLGRYETKKEVSIRLEQELLGTRSYLQKLLSKNIDYLVWPGGGESRLVRELAFKYGYKLVSKGGDLNAFSSGHREISRLAGFHRFRPKVLRPYLNILFLKLQLMRGEGNRMVDFIASAVKRMG